MNLEWRFAVLGGATAGLALGPLAMGGIPATPALALVVAAGAALTVARPRSGSSRAAAWIWLGLAALCAAVGGLVLGAARTGAIDGGALRGPVGRPVQASGFVTAVPRHSQGEVRVPVETAAGRILVQVPEPVSALPVGREIKADGVIREPAPWEAGYLRRLGIAQVLAAEEVRLTPRRRGGTLALVDRVRERAEAALQRAMPPRESALARGFVLGQDDLVDPGTILDFKRSGLAHLLAVSGQNVILLAALAMPLLALLGLSLRARLVWILALIAIYVPLTGAAPSIQRAGVMGAAGVVAAFAGRPRSRWYAILLAAFATLVVNPRSPGDVGWQLSFAAVIGIALWSGSIRDFLVRRLGETHLHRALAEGIAMTAAATLATAPLMAYHFEAVAVAALPANLLALPAVAPVMWAGMLVAMAGQAPFLPVEPINEVNALLIAYVSQVAHWLAAPDWALAELRLSGPLALLASYGAIGLAWIALTSWGRRRVGLRPRRGPVAAVGLSCLFLAVLPLAQAPSHAGEDIGAASLEITVLDVGQGDSILLEPADGEAVLVDAGPPGSGLAGELEEEGVDSLGVAVVTHEQSDHVSGLGELAGTVPVRSLVFGARTPGLLQTSTALAARPLSVARGHTFRSGSLRLDVLWPPRELVDSSTEGERRPVDSDEDPNRSSLVVLARWHRFSMLLTGDAEAEVAHLDPGPVDLLKVAHHGSEDAGLSGLLERTTPRAAVISVGQDNPYGHPSAPTLATLADHGVQVLRTDQHGEVEVEARSEGWLIRAG